MIKIVLLISLAAAFISCNSGNSKSDTDKDTKKTVGKKCDFYKFFVILPVKEITKETYSAHIHDTDTTYLLNFGYILKFNSDGNLTSSVNYLVPGHFIAEERYIYSNNGILIRTENFENGDSLVRYSENTVVDGENRLLKRFYDAGGTLLSESDLFTDENGFVLKEVSDDLLIEFVFDEENRLTEYVLVTGPINSRFVYEYKNMDLPKKTLLYNSDKKLVSETTHEYIHDKHGNFIQMNNYENGVLKSIEKRKIVY